MKKKVYKQFANFQLIDIDVVDFKERIEHVHMENCFLTDLSCKFSEEKCPANPFSSCIS